MYPKARCYQILSFAPHQTGPSLLHQGKEGFFPFGGLVHDAHYLYFSYVPVDRHDNELAIVRFPISGGQPERLGAIHEGIRLVTDGVDLYGRGGAGGTLYRVHLR